AYRPFEFYTEGPFSEYTRVETLHHSDTQGNFRVYLTLPEDYDPPGKHRMYVTAKEKPVGGTVNALAGIRALVEVDVPFPGYYAEMNINVPDVNEGEPVPITITVRNRGNLNISDARINMDILSDGKSVKTMSSESVPIEKGGAYSFQKIIPGGELKPGTYSLEVSLFYESKTRVQSKGFRVGTFDVNIVNYTDTLYNNTVNLFEIEVESLWNNLIETVYMDISIMDGEKELSTVKTPPFDLSPWGRKKSSLYWNTAGIPVGEYGLKIVLHYGKEVRTENRKIYIVAPPVEETPIPLSTIMLVIIAVLLIIFNIYFILGRRKKDEDKEKRKEAGKKEGES
ncbi:hypothetical protein KY359_05935, partial [Candidatus Woesearchaeota archaeon]|nr:hypothetical protein [Candidatus Woesearchaeota archaeon]